jgi:hypothetical protein
MRGREGDMRHTLRAGHAAQRRSDANSGMRVEDVLRAVEEIRDGRGGLGISHALTIKVALRELEDISVDGEAASRLELGVPRRDFLAGLLFRPLLVHAGAGGVLVREEPEETLEVGGDEDVHRGTQSLADTIGVRLRAIDGESLSRGGGVRRVLLVGSSAPEAVEDVILVRGADELVNGETHALGEVASEDVAKVSGGDDETRLCGGGEALLEGEVGGEVVGCLGEDAGPVDGVDGAELLAGVGDGVGEEGFDGVLGVC